MAESEMLVVGERISYTGVFSMRELYNVVERWMIQKNYDRNDKIQTEAVKPEGKSIDIVYECEKSIDDYTKFMINVKFYATDLKEVTVEMDGRKQKLNEGKILVILDSYVKTDWQGRMESKPFYYILRSVFNKYIFKGETSQNQKKLKEDTVQLKTTIKNYLNMWKSR